MFGLLWIFKNEKTKFYCSIFLIKAVLLFGFLSSVWRSSKAERLKSESHVFIRTFSTDFDENKDAAQECYQLPALF